MADSAEQMKTAMVRCNALHHSTAQSQTGSIIHAASARYWPAWGLSAPLSAARHVLRASARAQLASAERDQ